jgi:hypothetical protein
VCTGTEMGCRAAEILGWLVETHAWNGQCVELASLEAVATARGRLLARVVVTCQVCDDRSDMDKRHNGRRPTAPKQ